LAGARLRQLLADEAGLPRFDELSDTEWRRLCELPGTPTHELDPRRVLGTGLRLRPSAEPWPRARIAP